jgi:hypothetical protein
MGVHVSNALRGDRSALGSRRPGTRLGIVPVGPPPALAASLWVKGRDPDKDSGPVLVSSRIKRQDGGAVLGVLTG